MWKVLTLVVTLAATTALSNQTDADNVDLVYTCSKGSGADQTTAVFYQKADGTGAVITDAIGATPVEGMGNLRTFSCEVRSRAYGLICTDPQDPTGFTRAWLTIGENRSSAKVMYGRNFQYESIPCVTSKVVRSEAE